MACLIVALAATSCDGGQTGGSDGRSGADTVAGVAVTTTVVSTAITTRAGFFAAVPGTAERRCVDVDELRAGGRWRTERMSDGTLVQILDVRSGEFIAGNFLLLSRLTGDPPFETKIYWMPLDPDAAKFKTATLRIENADAPGPTVTTVLGSEDSWSGGPGAYFWPSGTPIPERGRWRLTIEADGHWGCFITSV